MTTDRYRELIRHLSLDQRRMIRDAGLTVEAVLANYPDTMQPLSTLGWSLILPDLIASRATASAR